MCHNHLHYEFMLEGVQSFDMYFVLLWLFGVSVLSAVGQCY